MQEAGRALLNGIYSTVHNNKVLKRGENIFKERQIFADRCTN